MASRRISVKVQKDHLQRLAITRPVQAVSELVWNAFDADATEVDVLVRRNLLTGVESIEISDNGSGIPFAQGSHEFSFLGNSWKLRTGKTKERNRALHGKNGQGRFRAFGLGRKVVWETTTTIDGEHKTYTLSGNIDQLGHFDLSDPFPTPEKRLGTRVTIQNVTNEAESYLSKDKDSELAKLFALYISSDPEVTLRIDGRPLELSKIVSRRENYDLGPIKLQDGNQISAAMTVLEWNGVTGRTIYLCDEDGFAISDRPAEVRAPGFEFCAYVKSAAFAASGGQGLADLDLTESVSKLLYLAREKLETHFRRRQKQVTLEVIARWKSENVYPYKTEPESLAERRSRDVFDICAIAVHQHARQFENQDRRTKALSLRLLREVVETNSGDIRKIFEQVLKLPRAKIEAFGSLLERTKLSSIIDLSAEVTDRIGTLRTLEHIFVSSDTRRTTKEREHLHRLVSANTWLFGEEFSVSFSEIGLTGLLREHLKILKRPEAVLEPVTKPDGRSGRLDILLASIAKGPNRNEDRHLVIELKRASTILGMKEYNQLLEYATAVIDNPRFDKSRVRWTFWLIGYGLDPVLQNQTQSSDRPAGLAHRFPNGEIWVKSWGQVIQDNVDRMEFYQRQLNIEFSESDIDEKIRGLYSKIVPESDEDSATVH